MAQDSEIDGQPHAHGDCELRSKTFPLQPTGGLQAGSGVLPVSAPRRRGLQRGETAALRRGVKEARQWLEPFDALAARSRRRPKVTVYRAIDGVLVNKGSHKTSNPVNVLNVVSSLNDDAVQMNPAKLLTLLPAALSSLSHLCHGVQAGRH